MLESRSPSRKVTIPEGALAVDLPTFSPAFCLCFSRTSTNHTLVSIVGTVGCTAARAALWFVR